MKRQLLSVLILFLLASPALAARQVDLTPGDEPFALRVLESGPDRTVLRLDLNHFTMDEVAIQGRAWTTLDLGRRAHRLERGLPDLPVLRESLRIPDDARMALRVLEAEYRDFTGVDVAPSRGNILRNVDPALVGYEFADFYGEDAWYPGDVAVLGEPYILRDTRGAVVEINPFRYNPAARTLRVLTGLTVEVAAAGPGAVNVLDRRPAARSIEFEKLYERHYLNNDGLGERYASIPEVGNMLVITYDAFHAAVEPLVAWKNQMGVPTTLVDLSAIGSTATQIKSYIQNLYDTEGVTFILLVGDAQQVPYYNNGGVSDPSYGLLAGTDSYPEAFVGRLSATNTTQVANQVAKFVEYERDAQPGADWYHKGVGIGSEQGDGIGDDGEADWVHMDNIRDDLLAFTYTAVDRIYPNTGASASMVTTAVNDGRSVINYCGHGSTTSWSTTGFSNTHVNALTNDNMLPFIVSVACVNGSFASTTCFAEAWLQASHGAEPAGAVGMYASTVNQSWAPPMSAQDEIVDLLVAGAKRTYGALCFNGSCQMMDEYGANGIDEFKYWTIFGDPSLRVRTDTPTALAVSHAGVIVPTADDFEADTEPGALVALSDGGVLIGSAFADAGGHAVVPIEGSLPAPGTTATLTVTSFNRVPHVEAVMVGDLLVPTCDVQPGAFVKSMLNDEVLTDHLRIANNGEYGSTLYYDIDLVDPNYPRGAAPAPRNITGSDCVADVAEFFPGTTVDITFTVSCVSNDSEWIKDIVIDFPAGTVVNSASSFTGGSGGAIPYNGATGDGASAEWHGTGTYGDIYPNESATATVNVTFASPTGDVVLDWILYGDDWGSAPHQVSGQIVIALAGPNVSVVSPDGGEAWGIGELRTIEYVAAGGPVNVTIELYRGLAQGWETLAGSYPAATGAFDWTVTGPVSADCLVKVSDADDPGVTDTSDAPFTIFRPLTWVALDQTEGQVPVGGEDDILVTFDSAGLPEGTYEAEIVVTSNAGDPVIVPVTVHVTEDLTPAGQTPAALALGQNHPNPFNPRTTISFGLAEAGPATLAVYDVGGRRVRTLVSGSLAAGQHHVVWDGRGDAGRALASGVYFYRLEAGGEVLGRKMLLLK